MYAKKIGLPIIIAIIVTLVLEPLIAIDASSFVGFIAFLISIVYFDRKSIQLQGPVVMRRTKRGRDFIDKIARAHPKFWKAMGNLGIILGIPTMILGTWFLISRALEVTGGAEGGLRLVLPGPIAAPTLVPTALVLPWWIWVTAIAIIIIPHEFSHGIMCRVDKVRVKTVGWLLLLIIPGAFVEPDEPQLERAKPATKARVYAAGSLMNLLTAFIIAAAFIIITPLLTTPTGLLVFADNDTTPAGSVNLTGAIRSIDDVNIQSTDDLINFLTNKNAGDVVMVQASNVRPIPGNSLKLDFFIPDTMVALENEINTYTITLADHPERDGAYLGVFPMADIKAVEVNVDLSIYQPVAMLFFWIWVLSFGIGLVNLLPMKPLDGGLLYEEVIKKFTKNKKAIKLIVRVTAIIILALLVFNILGPVFLGA